MSKIKKLGSWIRTHLTTNNIIDKVSEFLVWWVTLTRFYIRWKNWFTWERINRLHRYEFLKFCSWIIYLYLQLSWLVYFIDQETIYYLWKAYEIVMSMPSPFNAIDPRQAWFLYVVSQILYWGAYGVRWMDFMR